MAETFTGWHVGVAAEAIAAAQFARCGYDVSVQYGANQPGEVALRLCGTAAGRGETILYERHMWGPRAHGWGTTDEIPSSWTFTASRIEELFQKARSDAEPNRGDVQP